MKKIHTILMIDDNEGDHIITKTAIEEYDSSIIVHSAYDGQEALDLLATLDSPPDIILLDINMPGMDGHEFLEEYTKKEYATTAPNSSVVAMLTTSDQTIDRDKCMTYPFVKDYIIKPLDSSDIAMFANLL